MQHELFDKKLRDGVIQQSFDRQLEFSSGHGIILDYDAKTNTATVLMSKPGTDQVGDVLREVLCPTNIGIQGAAPEAGRPCWVDFKSGRNIAVITHYFNHLYDKYDYIRQTRAVINTPRFLFTM